MIAKRLGKAQNSRELQQLLRPLRELDNSTNLKYLAVDYLTLLAVLIPTVAFFRWRQDLGLAWAWNIPVASIAIILIGALQHRLAGLGHEAAHYTLLKNKFANELVSDLFCMFPIFTVTHQYRLVHLAHHQFTNDWDHDPDLLNIGKSKMMDRFPMSRARFIYNFYIRFFMPHVLLRYLWDVVYLSAFGKGISPYEKKRAEDETPNAFTMKMRPTSVLGVVYAIGLMVAMAAANNAGNLPLLLAAPIVGNIIAVASVVLLPQSAFFQSPFKGVYSIKFTNCIRLTYYTWLFAAFALARYATGVNWGSYYLLLWILPLVSSFAYFMLLRDVYQHANADDGKLTNSRVFFTDWFTRWSVFVYGMDVHIPHHMYPAIPHYHLHECHRVLMQHSDEYAHHVVECEGTFNNTSGKPTILDVMHVPTREPSDFLPFADPNRDSISA